MEIDQQSIMNALKDKGPEAWSAYLRRFEDDPQLTSRLSMQVIFHYAAPLAKDRESLDWGEVAVRAAELEARNCSGVEHENALLWAMNLRSWFICKMGSRSGHLVLDKEIILRWISEGLPLSVQPAREKAARFGATLTRGKVSSDSKGTQLIADDLRLLRRIKHRLNVAKVLQDCGQLTSDPELDEWLEIRELLP
ncbi:hypothetical protein [Occallatibacter riparius]|uniref:Uncharacterized protein n=1 Tax=Occallatibacter riparius TaxID=1002689 RepID=A0A9J7BJ33_9BACT|nr:hypothetical protein [Occallatibacter riparius]UWZ82489.1 hypothetical protein MOP44_18155 [Occallatibacter riparius]